MRENIRQIIISLILFLSCTHLNAQSIFHTVNGKVIDKDNQQPIVGVLVFTELGDSTISTTTDYDGKFSFSLKAGRYNVKFKMLGYQSFIFEELAVPNGSNDQLNISLQEDETVLSEVEVVYTSSKDEPQNTMAIASGRQFTVEETSRYAGGFDDPARMATSFAGVAGSTGSNGMVIRGNAPKGVLWQVEDMPIPDPNHLSNIVAFGGGSVTALSTYVLDNSDFYTGAFTSDYGNAMAGVFDLSLREGNAEKRSFQAQLGVNGIDFGAEGPFKKGGNATYLFNYRYSTFAVLAPILPEEMGFLGYQDLSFKVVVPTKNGGEWNVWAVGGADRQYRNASMDSTEWTFDDANQSFSTNILFGGSGISYQLPINKNGYWKNIVGMSGNATYWESSELNSSLVENPLKDYKNVQYDLTYKSYVHYKFGPKHTHRSGITISQKHYDINMREAENAGDPMQTFAVGNGNAMFLQAFSQSKFQLSRNWSMNLGVYAQYFEGNEQYSIEPRASVKYQLNPWHSLSFSYGLHSQTEALHYYLLPQQNGDQLTYPNKNLDFSKAHHYVLGYNWNINNSLRFKSEIFYQDLYNIPVIEGSYFSMLNLTHEFYVNGALVNEGTGRNVGIDLTFEQFLKNGFYYTLTSSIFDSKYTGGDGVERNSQFNKNYVINVLGGKEWYIGAAKNKVFSLNGKFTFMGGDRRHPLDEQKTEETGDVVYNNDAAYSQQYPSSQILSVSALYKTIKPKYTSQWTLQIINALGAPEYYGYQMDQKTGEITDKKDVLILPNIAYKVMF
ncbi:TonB-dependent receptor [Flammeovirga agarivorans]|uniref:TonB-dependent receptor n=1 Tax=Flammeovirga agarivorans TaxID=2726742 RepID=A0A7X8SPK4_9BACT|nr:TonB-dependent receptor [Flammeovirga agarivorans]NLR94034.1 TonB-dependent receptor [Flammeovirga agarivorans]